MILTKADIARLLDITPAGIYKQIDKNFLSLTQDSRVDISNKKNQNFLL